MVATLGTLLWRLEISVLLPTPPIAEFSLQVTCEAATIFVAAKGAVK